MRSQEPTPLRVDLTLSITLENVVLSITTLNMKRLCTK
jgi:hypothetical protein